MGRFTDKAPGCLLFEGVNYPGYFIRTHFRVSWKRPAVTR
jgi:hypothetical protein